MTQSSTRFTSLVVALLVTSSVVNAGTEKTIAPSALVVGTPRPTDYPTASPITDVPTPSPTTPEPTLAPLTSAPTPCGNRLYYVVVIDGATKCSNGYDSVGIASPDYFETSAECCAELIVDADDYCKVVDVCNPTDAPTDSPTDVPTPYPVTADPTPAPVTDVPTPAPTELIIVTPAPTTDGPTEAPVTDVPTPSPVTDEPTPSPVTDEPTPAPVAPEPTEEPTSMVVVVETPSPITPAPTVSPITPAPTPCEGRLYYIITDIDGSTQCSNGMDNAISIPDTFATSAECCAELLDLQLIDCNEDCNYIDVCAEPPTPQPSPTTATLPAIETTFEPTYGSSPLGSGVESSTPTTVVVTPAPTPLTSIGSTPTVGTEKDSGYVNMGPRR